MPYTDKSIRNEQVIPTVESDLFVNHPDAQFAVGVLAVGDVVQPRLNREFVGYLRLRANVYADQTRMIPREHVRDDGTETDENDRRSVHFGVVENLGSLQRVVGAMRLIVKSGENPEALPVEEFWPETFETSPAPMGSTEVSRYICRHEDRRVQRAMTWPLFSASLAVIFKEGLGPTYGVIEPITERDLRIRRVPMTRIADPVFVPEYNYDNLAVLVDTPRLAAVVNQQQGALLDVMEDDPYAITYSGSRVLADVEAAA